MTALTEFLFPAPAHRSLGAIASWWEKRRLAYNVVVGSAGLLTLGTVSVISSIPPNAHSETVPFAAIVVVGIMANICFLLGPAVEWTIEKLSRGQVLPTGPVLFRMGLTLSTGLVLLPTLVFAADFVFRVIRWLI